MGCLGHPVQSPANPGLLSRPTVGEQHDQQQEAGEKGETSGLVGAKARAGVECVCACVRACMHMQGSVVVCSVRVQIRVFWKAIWQETHQIAISG